MSNDAPLRQVLPHTPGDTQTCYEASRVPQEPSGKISFSEHPDDCEDCGHPRDIHVMATARYDESGCSNPDCDCPEVFAQEPSESAEIDSFLELGAELGGILRAHGIDRPLVAHDIAKRLTRSGFRLAALPELASCRGNARIGEGCGQLAVLSQGVCLNCLTRASRSTPPVSEDSAVRISEGASPEKPEA